MRFPSILSYHMCFKHSPFLPPNYPCILESYDLMLRQDTELTHRNSCPDQRTDINVCAACLHLHKCGLWC